MLKFWKTMNTIYEKTMLGIFVIAFLVVIYAMYDTWYVFDRANDDSLLAFKPNQVKAVENDDSKVIRDMVGWITVDDTNIDYPIMQGVDTPCAIGFGISTPEQAAKFSAKADGVIVGSAIIKLLEKYGKEAPKYVGEYVRSMKAAMQ